MTLVSIFRAISMKRLSTTTCFLFLFAIHPAFAVTDEDKRIFDTQFAERIKNAKASSSRSDDVELAKQLINLAFNSDDAPGLQTLLCQSAYELTFPIPPACDTAAAAMRILANNNPDDRLDVLQKAASAQKKYYQFLRRTSRIPAGKKLAEDLLNLADERVRNSDLPRAGALAREGIRIARFVKHQSAIDRATALIERLNRLTKNHRRMKILENKLKNNPGDKETARILVFHYLLEMQDLKSAKQFVILTGDKTLSNILSLMKKDQRKLTPKDKKQLGLWYYNIRKHAPADSHENMINRAAKLLTDYLNHSKDNDSDRKLVELTLNELFMKIDVPKKGLVLHYSFDQDTVEGNRVKDLSGANRHGSTKADIRLAPGKIGKALVLRGADRINAGNSLNFNVDDKFSYGGWFYLNTPAQQVALSRMAPVSGFKGWDLHFFKYRLSAYFIHNWRDPKKGVNALFVSSRVYARQKTWVHGFVTYDGSSKAAGINLFLDGRQVNTKAYRDNLSGNIDAPNLRAIVGSRGGKIFWFDGMMDDLRVYNRLLTPLEIQRLYRLPNTQSNPK